MTRPPTTATRAASAPAALASGPTLLALVLLLAAATPAAAQVFVDPSRVGESVRPLEVPTLLDDPEPEGIGLEEDSVFAPPSDGDSDLGQQLILKESPKLRLFQFLADTFGYWTDNPANVSADTEDDYFWGARFSLGAQPRITGRLFFDALVSQQIYRYDSFDFLDYEYFDASAGLIYVEPKLWNTTFFGQVRYNRMTNDNFGNELYGTWSVRAGIQKSFLIDRRNSVHVNLMGDWDFETDAPALDRDEYIGDLSYNFRIMRDLVFALSYRFTWFDYRQVDRTDYLNLVGASIAWSPKNWLDVYVAANYSDNSSDIDFFDYQAATAGGGLGVRIRF